MARKANYSRQKWRLHKMTISYRKTFQGAWVLSAFVGGYYEEKQFMGYTKKEATSLFREYVKGLSK